MPSVKDTTQQENETFPQQNFTPKPANPFKTILLIVVGLILFSSVAYAGFWYGQKSQTPVKETTEKETTSSPEKAKEELPVEVDETAGWKTYRSSCGFQLKYPTSWNVTKYFVIDSDGSCAYLKGEDYTQGLDNREGKYITISRLSFGEKSDISTLEDYIHSSEKINQPPQAPIVAIDKTYGLFSGKQYSGYGYDPGVSFVFVRNATVYEVNWSEETPEALVEQILSTFRFE
ncbi:hypothetical protein COY33_01255 [candidate division WWE3 bacterium CG_4_10_14_0_2_um_filter_42_7]|uniref:Uncharacterized protein n=2 Tax=Katanobacteria TaxID=422282 RepID=A0A2H0X8W5_UNCKA|nr:MAG: hypothetical protein COT51_03240 [candidate division WWE3 bacterium CG08_land_8_20_14_0_20_41_15]PIZ43575.1 MAG: hypothetical protein COY33_01255 [candidate division WWE3 bacterium CG_4_10_14_0_2_um_filter_42_7]